MPDPKEKEEVKEPKKGVVTCGFKDAQNTDGKDNVCVLGKDHDGDHSTGEYSFSDLAAVPFPKGVQKKLDEREKKKAK